MAMAWREARGTVKRAGGVEAGRGESGGIAGERREYDAMTASG